MWFNNVEDIFRIAVKSGTSIFVVKDPFRIDTADAIVLEPENKAAITIEQVRKITASLGLKQTHDRFIIVRPADKLSLSAANALLKNLEEPGEHVHYILITDSLSRVIPTIRSRAAIYFLKPKSMKSDEIVADEKDIQLAKKLIVANPRELIEITEHITKKKTARVEALKILALTVEVLYKSYYVTGKDVFLKKIPGFINAYENIDKNGHVKLHLIADLC